MRVLHFLGGMLRAVLAVEREVDRVVRRQVMMLPLSQRLSHVMVRRHVLGIIIGSAVMVFASHLGSSGISDGRLWDALTSFLHACGAVPALRHVERLWGFLLDERGV